MVGKGKEKEWSQNSQPMHDGKSPGPLAIYLVLCNRNWAFAHEGKTEDEMFAEAVPFYKDLFSKHVTTLSALSKIGSFIKHDEGPFSTLAKLFDEEECLENSQAMHVGKSPGPDGPPNRVLEQGLVTSGKHIHTDMQQGTFVHATVVEARTSASHPQEGQAANHW